MIGKVCGTERGLPDDSEGSLSRARKGLKYAGWCMAMAFIGMYTNGCWSEAPEVFNLAYSIINIYSPFHIEK